MGHIGNTSNAYTSGRNAATQVCKHAPGIAKVFQDVSQNKDVKATIATKLVQCEECSRFFDVTFNHATYMGTGSLGGFLE